MTEQLAYLKPGSLRASSLTSKRA